MVGTASTEFSNEKYTTEYILRKNKKINNRANTNKIWNSNLHYYLSGIASLISGIEKIVEKGHNDMIVSNWHQQ